MKRIQIQDNITFSRLIYGTWRLKDAPDVSVKSVREMVETCLELGITTFDQADIYGAYEAEELFGKALNGTDLRSEMEIVTKCGIVAPLGRHRSARVKHYDTSRQHVLASTETSLRLMGFEVIDLLLIHRPDPLMNHRETAAALDELVDSGKVKIVGVSNFKAHDVELLQSAMQTRICVNQIELSVLHHAPFTDGDVAYAQKKKMPIMAWSPLAGGAMFAKPDTRLMKVMEIEAERHRCDVGAVALSWLLTHPGKIMPILGTSNKKRLALLAKAADIRLSRQSWFEIYSAALGKNVP